MNRRSVAQKIADDRVWPIRVYVVVPGNGFSGAGIDPHAWLIKELGLAGFAWHATGRMSDHVAAVYFRTLPDLQRFLDAFPTLQLADGTGSPLYHSPMGRPIYS